VATEGDVRRIALALPGTTERPSYGTPGFRVADKLFLRMHDQPGVLVLWCEDEHAKRTLLARDSSAFFTTPHYDDTPASSFASIRWIGRRSPNSSSTPGVLRLPYGC